MVEIPNALAESIRRGDCVLWTGAGLAGLADRPTWKEILTTAAKSLDDDARKGMEALIEKGRLRPVLDHLRRQSGDALREQLGADGGSSDVPKDAAKLAALPWATVFATVHPEFTRSVAGHGSDALELITPDELDGRSLGNGAGRFVLHTPADLASWSGHPDLHDVVVQAARAHTILLLGFSAGDPDLEMVLDALQQVSPDATHYALVGGLSTPERDAIGERTGVEVLDPGDSLSAAIDALATAAEGKAGDAKDDARARAALDLALIVSDLPLRADVASGPAMAVDPQRVADHVETLGSAGLAGLGAGTLLRAGSVLLAHGRKDLARTCFEAAVAAARTEQDKALGRFGRAWVEFADGNEIAALEGLRAAGKQHPAAALVPTGYGLESVLARHGARCTVTATNADGKTVELEVTTLGRALASGERDRFAKAAERLSALSNDAIGAVIGGQARGRRMIVERAHQPGQALSDGLATGVLSLQDAARLVGLLADGLSQAHGQKLVHGAVKAQDVILTDAGPVLRGFGPASVLRNTGSHAPEVLAGGAASASSDAFDLGVLAFRAVTGAAAAAGASASSLLAELDPRVDAVFGAAMHPDPDERSSVAQLSKALQTIADSPDARPEAAVAAAPVGPPEDPNDLEGWTWLLEKKPTHGEARVAIDRIEKEARAAGQWDRVAEVLSVRAELTQAVAERVALLRELAGLFEKELAVPANAFDTVRKLVDSVDVGDQVALIDDLERLAETTGRWGPLADAMAAVAARLSDAEPQAKLYLRMGEVQSEKLGATERAIAAYEHAAELDPSASTLSALVPLYRKAMRMAELATTLLSLADHQEGADKVASLMAAADVLQTDLGETEGAFASLMAVLEIDAAHADALEQAEDLARQLEDWEGLADLLARRAEATVDGPEAAEQLREAAQLCIEQLDDAGRASGHLSKLLERDRSDRAAAELLAGLLRDQVPNEAARRPQLVDTLGVLIDLADSAQERAMLLAEQADLLDQEVDGKERAADARERIIEALSFDRPEAKQAAAALEKWYRRSDDETALVRLLGQQGDSSDLDKAERVEAWSKLLQLRKSAATEDREAVVDVLEKLSGLEPDNKQWRDDLLIRYLDQEDFKKAGPLIRAQVSDEEDPKRKAELLLRGGLLREQIGKADGAIDALEQAVELDETLHEAWLALRDLYVGQEQPLKAIEAQVRGARHNPNRADRVRLTFEAANKYLDDLGQPERGMTLLEELVEFDPDHREATGMLVDRLVGSGDLERAWPHAQTYVMQVRSQSPNDKALNVRALSTAGRCALSVGEKDRARDYLEKARVFEATNLNVLRLLADIAMDSGEYTDALRHYQSVVLGVGSKMAPPDLSRLYVHMADARKGMEEPAKAVQMAERALEIDPDSEVAIEKLIEFAEAGGNSAAKAKAKQRQADLLQRRHESEEDETKKAELIERRVTLLHELAGLHEELKAPIEAVRCLEALLEIKPDDPGVLHEILGVFTKSERWRDATNVIERLAEAQSERSHQAAYLWAGALIFRDHLDEPDNALAWIRRVLEVDPLHAKAYPTGIEILEKGRNFKELARLMRGRLKALPKDAPPQERVTLFAGLGKIYEENLGDPKTAIAAYNQSVRFATGDLAGTQEIRDRRLKVMRIAVQLGDDEMDKAIHQGHALISDNPMEFEVYHRLVELYLRRGDRDRARALSRTLVFLKQADEAEQELAEKTAGGSTTARRKISRELWRKAVMHRDQNSRLSDILAAVWPMVAARENHEHSKYGVSRDQRTEVSIQSPEAVARFLAHASKVIDAPQPDFFLHDEAGGLTVDALVDTGGGQQRVFTSVLAGKQAQAEKDEAALKFITGRAVARARPDHILGAMLRDAGSLRNALYGAISVSVADAEIPTDVETEAKRLADLFRKYLSPSKIEQIGKVATKLVKSEQTDTKIWLQAAAHTVTRAGFVLCDDLQTAARILTNEGDAGLAVPVKDRIRDLVGYSVSDAYLKLRREIGLAI